MYTNEKETADMGGDNCKTKIFNDFGEELRS